MSMSRAIGKTRQANATVWEVLQDGLRCSECERGLRMGDTFVRRGPPPSSWLICSTCDPQQTRLVRPYRGKHRVLYEHEVDGIMDLTPGHRRLAPALLTLLRDRQASGINHVGIDEAGKKLLLGDAATRRLAAAMALTNLIEIDETWQTPWQQTLDIRLVEPPANQQAGFDLRY
jgi:hypothetical protein